MFSRQDNSPKAHFPDEDFPEKKRLRWNLTMTNKIKKDIKMVNFIQRAYVIPFKHLFNPAKFTKSQSEALK